MTTPKVFISYSHDSPEHKAWVMKLAQKLMSNGIEVLLDLWELGPGVDLARFMEQSLKVADRTLMICTEKYVAKADEGKGGVGYEKTIMTAEYMQNVDSTRVIPIIRSTGAKLVPAFLRTKMYLDFSTDDRAEYNFDELVRELHGKPLYTKPALGAVPSFGTGISPEPMLAEDPVIKAMKVVMAVYEANTSATLFPADLIVEAKKQGMSRSYFEKIQDELIQAEYMIFKRGIHAYELSDQGRDFALSNGLV